MRMTSLLLVVFFCFVLLLDQSQGFSHPDQLVGTHVVCIELSSRRRLNGKLWCMNSSIVMVIVHPLVSILRVKVIHLSGPTDLDSWQCGVNCSKCVSGNTSADATRHCSMQHILHQRLATVKGNDVNLIDILIRWRFEARITIERWCRLIPIWWGSIQHQRRN
jgi:hypothetical protein